MHYLKKRFLNLALLLLCSPIAFSQTVLIPFREGKLWGYSDSNGVIKIKPDFDKVRLFKPLEKVAEVIRGNKISLLNTHGKMLFPFSDGYEYFADCYRVTSNKKKALYTKQGVQLVPFEYDNIDIAALYDGYKNQYTKAIASKNYEYFLIDLKSGMRKKISRPNHFTSLAPEDGIIDAFDQPNIISIPLHQVQSSAFPKLKGYSNLAHCETIYHNGKPVFYLFCVRTENKLTGYIGQNGVAFYKD